MNYSQVLLYENLLANIDDCALIIHNDTIIALNSQAEAYLGINPEMLKGKPFSELFFCKEEKCSSINLLSGPRELSFTGLPGKTSLAGAMQLTLDGDNGYMIVKLYSHGETNEAVNGSGSAVQLPLAMLVTDATGLVTYADEQFLNLGNYNLADITGKSITEIFPLDNIYLYNFLKGSKSQTGSDIVRIKGKDGSEKLLHVDVMHLPVENNYFWLFRDDSESLEASKKLQQKEQYLTGIFKAAPVGIGVISHDSVFYLNQYFLSLSGYGLNEILDNTLECLFEKKADYDKLIAYLKNYQQHPHIFECEVPWRKKSGVSITVKLSVTYIHGIGPDIRFAFSVLDISESLLIRQQLKISEGRYRKLVNEAADAILIVQLNKGLITETNQKAALLTGYSAEELIGSHISRIFPPGTNDEFLRLFINENWINDHPITRTEIISRTGNIVPVEINNCLVEDTNGKAIIGFYRDLSDRVRWEQMLKESELRYKTLFNSVKEGIVIAEPGPLSIVLTNDTICQWFKYKPDELTGSSIDILFANDRQLFENISKSARSGESIVQNVLCKTNDSKILYADIRFSSLQMEGKTYSALYFTNVTERYEHQMHLEQANKELVKHDEKLKALNQQLQKSFSDLKALNKELKTKSREYYLLFNEMASGFAVHQLLYNYQGKPVDFRYLSVNPAFEKLTGLEAKHIVGKTAREINPGIEDFIIETFGEVAKTGKPKSFLDYAAPAGKYFETVAYSPDTDICAVIFNDVTQRENTTNEFNKIFNLSIDFICIANFEGLLLKTNPTFKTVLGYNEDELRNYKLYDFVYGPDKIATQNILQSEILTGSPESKFQNRMVAKDGSVIWVSWIAQPLVKGKSVFAIGHNITDQKKTEFELISAKEKAIESDRLKSAFLANMSHEVRTPMNAIIGFSSLLETAVGDTDKQIKYTQIIKNRCDDLLRIIDDILDISRIEAGLIDIYPAKFSLKHLMHDVYEIFKQRLDALGKSHIELVLKPLPGDIIMFNDNQRILQVLNNLLDNAIKFTLEGKITFGCREYIPEKILFFITDTGIGIPKEKHKVIFQRFRQAEDNLTRKFGGNGLGLAISKPLIQQMGGNIWLDSKPGAGSTFYFTVDKKLGQQQASELTRLRNKKVLIIEDDRHSIDYLKLLLEQLGSVVFPVKSGKEALTILELGEKFDIILMDIQLSDISGIEVTKAIRKFDLLTPIIAETAYTRDEDRQSCLNAGCNDFISKPIDDDELIRLMIKYID
ncbi:MAG: PAS domain S-box protein [Bacteroidales bacterium]|nr:PAS domain S-box protein [Bacteroidales bacterium]